MALNYVEDVASMYRDYIDEPNEQDYPKSKVTRNLAQGYEDFRNFVVSVNAQILAQRVTITAGTEYDLGGTEAVVLFGSTATTRLLRLLRVGVACGSGRVSWWHPAISPEELETASHRYMLDGQTLRFSPAPGAVVVEYIPEGAVDWTQQTAGDAEWIDDFTNFHDLIALYAMRHYFIFDDWSSMPASEALQRREGEFLEYLSRRHTEATTQVADVTPWD